MHYDLSGLRVLVAEDNDFTANLLSSVLKGLGVGTVLRSPNGLHAKSRLELFANERDHRLRQDIHLVLADWLMAPMDGLALLRWMRGHPLEELRYMPFVMVSAYSTAERVMEARDAGATEFLTKPISVSQVASHLMEVIDRPRRFVKADGFFGPDRRRKIELVDGGDRRDPDSADVVPVKRAGAR